MHIAADHLQMVDGLRDPRLGVRVTSVDARQDIHLSALLQIRKQM